MAMSSKRAGILFDLDGVLINSEEAHYEATRRAFLALGLPELSEELYRDCMIGRPDREAIMAALTKLELPADQLTEVLRLKAKAYHDLLSRGAVALLWDGIATAVAALEAGYPVAVVTGALKNEAQWALRAAGLEGRINTVVTAEDVTHGKPHPEPYLLGCYHLGVAPLSSVAVEDAPAGVRAARAAGLSVVAVARRMLPGLEEADRIVTKLTWQAVVEFLAAT